MKAVIIEDEALFAEHLESLLYEVRDDIEIVAKLTGVSDSIEWFRKNSEPDIVFSDIRLIDGISFEIFHQIHAKSPIVFITAFDDYAINAFQYNSLHYLLKPVTLESLSAVFDKYDTLIRADEVPEMMSQIIDGVGTNERQFPSRLFVRRGEEVVPIDINNISCINTTDKVVICYMKDGKDFVLGMSLKDVSERLDSMQFKKISRQWILNVSAVRKFYCGLLGRGHVILEPEIDIELSREKYNQVIKDFLR